MLTPCYFSIKIASLCCFCLLLVIPALAFPAVNREPNGHELRRIDDPTDSSILQFDYDSHQKLDSEVHHDKRVSEFLGGPGKRVSEFLGGPGKRVSEFLGGPGKRFLVDDSYVLPKRVSEFLGGPGKRVSEFLGGPGKRVSEFLGGPGKRNLDYYQEGDDHSAEMDLRASKRVSEFLGGPGKRYRIRVRYNQPKGSEFLGGPGRR